MQIPLFTGKKFWTPVVWISDEEDARCQMEARQRDLHAASIGARNTVDDPEESLRSNYMGVLGELAVCKHLEVPMKWGAWVDGRDAEDKQGLDVVRFHAEPVQVKYNRWTYGDFYLKWKYQAMRAALGILATPINGANGSGPWKPVVLRAWLTAERFLEKWREKDYGRGPVRAVSQADMFDMADFPR